MHTKSSVPVISTLVPALALLATTGCNPDDNAGDEIGDTAMTLGESTTEDEEESESETSDSGTTEESTETTDESTEESTESTDTTDESTDTTTETTDEGTFCEPGESQCQAGGLATCLEDGSAFAPPVACGDSQQCVVDDCVELCELIQVQVSSVGCSFFAHKMDNFTDPNNPVPEDPDSFVVGNVSEDKQAIVQLYFMPNGTNVEQPQGNAVIIPPGGTQSFEMTNSPIESVSLLRKGGTYRVESNIPVVAYLHSPLEKIQTNDASMLLPEHALRMNHVVASYYPWLTNYYPSYFNVIAVEDQTIVSWTPPVTTNAGVGVPLVLPNGTGQVVMNRGDTLQVVASNHVDVSGTYVTADKPIAVISGNEVVNVPAGVKFADHIEEQMIPLDYWGSEYVGPKAPPRGAEKFHWRIYGGADNVTVNTSPAQQGFPRTLDRGEWHYFNTTVNLVFTGNGPFMPVQYLEGKNENGAGATTGDPSMYQMVPTEQFLDAYAFTTGIGYTTNYVQVIRQLGGPDVTVDGVTVTGYVGIGNYEVANWVITEGTHFATSDAPFGIINIGYASATSYAYPGGMQLAEINPQ